MQLLLKDPRLLRWMYVGVDNTGKADCVPGNETHRSNTIGVMENSLVIRRECWILTNDIDFSGAHIRTYANLLCGETVTLN